MVEGSIQYNKINNIYFREWRRYCNLLKNIVNLGFDSGDNDLSELQYTPLPSQIYVIYVIYATPIWLWHH